MKIHEKIILTAAALLFSQTSLAYKTLHCDSTYVMATSFSVTGEDKFFGINCTDGYSENIATGKVRITFWSLNYLGRNEATDVMFDAKRGCSKQPFEFSGVDFKFHFSANFELVGLPLKSEGAVGSFYFQSKRVPVTCIFRKSSQDEMRYE